MREDRRTGRGVGPDTESGTAGRERGSAGPATVETGKSPFVGTVGSLSGHHGS